MPKDEGQRQTAAAERLDDTTPELYRFEVKMEWGEFEFRVLDVRDMIQLRPKIRENWGGPLPIAGTPDGVADLNSAEYAIASGLAEMELAALTLPQGWVWRTLRNPDRLWDLWLAYQKARDSFREELGGF